jgi:hypothetical protein
VIRQKLALGKIDEQLAAVDREINRPTMAVGGAQARQAHTG